MPKTSNLKIDPNRGVNRGDAIGSENHARHDLDGQWCASHAACPAQGLRRLWEAESAQNALVAPEADWCNWYADCLSLETFAACLPEAVNELDESLAENVIQSDLADSEDLPGQGDGGCS